MAFTVSLSGPSSQTVTVDFATANGSASAPGDFTASGGTLTFAPGETSKTVSVPIVNDVLDEPDETFTVTLANPTNAAIQDGQATGTIGDDDQATQLLLQAYFYTQDGGTQQLTCQEPPGACPPGSAANGAGAHNYRVHLEVKNITTAAIKTLKLSGPITLPPGKKPAVTATSSSAACGKPKVSKGLLTVSAKSFAAGAVCTYDVTVNGLSFSGSGLKDLGGPFAATGLTITPHGALQVSLP